MKGRVASADSWIVPPGAEAIRLDAFVRRCLPHLSLREARRIIEDRLFWVGDRPARKGDRLFAGDVLSYRGALGLLARAPSPEGHLHAPIVHEDECVLVVDKPAAMATHGFSGRERKSLANFLAAARPTLRGVGASRWEPGLVHRLDRDTSGLVLVAKDRQAFDNLRSQFRRGSIRKKYWALVWGRLAGRRRLDYPLAHDPRDRKRMMALKRDEERKIRAQKWPALTRIEAVAWRRGFTLLDVEIETGVTHQIRAHLEALGYPLVGDPLYGGDRPDPFALKRQFLHAHYLGFRHPRSGVDIVVTSALPEDLGKILDRLGIRRPCP